MFGERLRMLRKERNLKLKDVAKEFGITIGAWAKYERNEANPTLANLSRMADYFGVTTDFLLGRTNIRKWNFTGKLDNKEELISGIELDELERDFIKEISSLYIGDITVLHDFFSNLTSVFRNYKEEKISQQQIQDFLEALLDMTIYVNDLVMLREENKELNLKVLNYCEKLKILVTKYMNKIFLSLYEVH